MWHSVTRLESEERPGVEISETAAPFLVEETPGYWRYKEHEASTENNG